METEKNEGKVRPADHDRVSLTPSTSLNDDLSRSLLFLSGSLTRDWPLRKRRSNAKTHTCTLMSETSASWNGDKRASGEIKEREREREREREKGRERTFRFLVLRI